MLQQLLEFFQITIQWVYIIILSIIETYYSLFFLFVFNKSVARVINRVVYFILIPVLIPYVDAGRKEMTVDIVLSVLHNLH